MCQALNIVPVAHSLGDQVWASDRRRQLECILRGKKGSRSWELSVSFLLTAKSTAVGLCNYILQRRFLSVLCSCATILHFPKPTSRSGKTFPWSQLICNTTLTLINPCSRCSIEIIPIHESMMWFSPGISSMCSYNGQNHWHKHQNPSISVTAGRGTKEWNRESWWLLAGWKGWVQNWERRMRRMRRQWFWE